MAEDAEGGVPAMAGESALRLSASRGADCQIVSAAGEVDVSNVHRLHGELSVSLGPDRPVIADLSAATFLDASGLRALMMNQRNAALRGARLLIVPSASVAAWIDAGAGGAVSVYADLAAAFAAVSRPAAESSDEGSAAPAV